MRTLIVLVMLVAGAVFAKAETVPDWAKPTIDCREAWDQYPIDDIYFNFDHCREAFPRCQGSWTMFSTPVVEVQSEVKCYVGERCHCRRTGGH